MKFFPTFLIGCAPLITGSAAAAQVPRPGAEVIGNVTDCRSISDDAQRLACYDVAVARLSSATERRDIVVVDRQQIRETRRTLFGLPLPRLFGGSDEESEVEEIREIETTVSRASGIGHHLWVLQLADGSVWQTTEVMRVGEPEAGNAIRIRRTGVGSYFASIDGGRAVRVQRVR